MNKSITIDFVDLNNKNKTQKFNKAMGIIAYQLGIQKSGSKKEYKGEGFYFDSQKQLTEKWLKYFDQLTRDIYKTLCTVLGLPESTVITKADVIYKGKVLYTPELGLPLKQSDLDRLVKAITKVLNKNKKAGETLVKESQVLGRLLEKYYQANQQNARKLSLDDLKAKNAKFDTIVNRPSDYFDIDRQTRDRIELYEQAAGQRIQNIDDSVLNGIKQTLIDGCVNQKSKSEVSQDLFNKLGGANRDWKKIADTEIQNNMNNAYINAEVRNTPENEPVYFQRMEVIDDRTCNYCRKMNGQVVKFSNIPLQSDKIEDKFAGHAIWEGKTWNGNKEECCSGVFHPNCRGVWLRWYSFDN